MIKKGAKEKGTYDISSEKGQVVRELTKVESPPIERYLSDIDEMFPFTLL